MKRLNAAEACRPFSEQREGELRTRTVRSAGVTLASNGMGLAIQVVSTVVLARLLAPADFGVVAIVTTFSLLLMNFGGNGFTEAVVQREELDHGLLSNLFWINLTGGSVLTIAFAASGFILAAIFHDKRVQEVSWAMSLTIFFTSASVIHLALLKRAMRFSVTAANDIVARIISVVAAIVLARAGMRYWALVAAAICIPLSTTIGAWYLCRWVPGRPRRVSGTGSVVKFAANTYGRFSINYFTRNVDNVLIGWRFDAQALGFYKKAYDLFALSAGQLVAALTLVAISALSRLKSDAAQYRRYFLNATSIMAFLGMGLAAVLTLAGRDLIRVLLGPGWETTGRIFTFFGPGVGVMVLYSTHSWLHLSVGRADRWFRWGMIEFGVTAALFALGIHWGPEGIALAWTVSFWILLIPAMWYAGKPIELEVQAILSVTWRYIASSLLAGGATALVLHQLASLFGHGSSRDAALRFSVVSVSFLVFYLGAIVLTHWGWAPIFQILRVVQDLLPSKRSGSQSSAEAHAERRAYGSDEEHANSKRVSASAAD